MKQDVETVSRQLGHANSDELRAAMSKAFGHVLDAARGAS